MDNYVRSCIYALECGLVRMKWYQETGETRYLSDSVAYIDVANIYMREIKKNEDCEVVN